MDAPLTALLAADGITVWDVPAKLAARGRLLSTGHGRKSDKDDVLSVAVAASATKTLPLVEFDTASVELKMLNEYRDDLVRTRTRLRTRTVNRLHAIMTLLILAGAPRKLTADIAVKLLRRVYPDDHLAMTRRMIGQELIVEIRHLDKRVTIVSKRLTVQTAATATTLPAICGVGPLTAAQALARTSTT